MTITDLDAIRARLGVPDLTSEDLMTDRQAFWDRAERDAVLLTDGLLRADNSELWLDYDVTEDDVDWEARFSGPDGAGYVLAFRPDQDMPEVQAAVDAGVGPLDGATVWPDLHLLARASPRRATPSGRAIRTSSTSCRSRWSRRTCARAASPSPRPSAPTRRSRTRTPCWPKHDVAGLDDLPAVAISFGDDVATAWLGARSRRPGRPGRPGDRLADHRTDRVRRRLLR